MLKVLIHSQAKSCKDGSVSPKDYPYFDELIEKIKNNFENVEINQLGSPKDKKLNKINNYYFDVNLQDIKNLINEHDLWISVDSFLPHYCNCYNLKNGFVIYTVSDPLIFGYKNNINLIKDRKYIRDRKIIFIYYKKEDFNKNAFIDYNMIFEKIKEKLSD